MSTRSVLDTAHGDRAGTGGLIATAGFGVFGGFIGIRCSCRNHDEGRRTG